MANDNIKVGVNISDNGTAEQTGKKVDKLQKKLEQAQATAEKINAGGTAGSRAAASKSQTMSNTGYRQAKGITEATGASARDFARQSQGLGGLVRLYATYAANIFAVTAAFGALSRAMDTTNMIRGLDQLGAASGQNLGQLSKDLVAATDGAISLQDAMKAVAQTTSAGMSSENVERLAKVARSASLALGVAMPDAISRLSRGITKLEPELLDELGIMTKLDPAVQKYAREMGKSTSQLTDFERRQAFANAVLEEGEKKFGALADAAANPYDKLLASLKNVTQSGLEVVNRVLTPLIDALSSSPTALAALITVLGATLLKQAIPALGQFRQGMAAAVQESQELYAAKAQQATEARNAIAALNQAELDDIADRREAESSAIADTLRKNTVAKKLLKKELEDLSDEDFKRIERSAKAQERLGDTKEAENIRAASKALKEAKDAHEGYFQAVKDSTTYKLAQNAAEKAGIANAKQSIVANAAQNASLIGMGNAFKLMKAEIAAADLQLNKFQKTALMLRGSFAVLGGQISAFGGMINKALGWVGMLFTVASLLDSVFSTNAKELQNLNSALDKAESAAEAAGRSFEYLSEQDVVSEYSIANVKTMSTAFNELSSSAKKVAKDAAAAKQALSLWERIKDTFFGFFGADLDTKIANSLSLQIVNGLKLIQDSGLGEEAKKTFQSILNVDPTNLVQVTEKLKGLSDAARLEVVAELEKLNIVIGNSNLRLQEFNASLEESKTTFQDYIKSTANNDPMFKLGASLSILSTEMSQLKTDGIDEVSSAMEKLAENTQVLAALGPKFADAFAKSSGTFTSQSLDIKKYRSDLASLTKEITEKKKALDKVLTDRGFRVTDAEREGQIASASQRMTPRLEKALRELKDAETQALVVQANLSTTVSNASKDASNLFSLAMSEALEKGAKYLNIATKNAAQAAKNIIDEAKLAGLTITERAQEQNRLAEQSIKTEIDSINANIELIRSQERLKASIDLATAEAAAGKADAGLAEAQALEVAKAVSDTLSGKKLTTELSPEVANRVQAQLQPGNLAIATQQAARTQAEARLRAQQEFVGPRNISAANIQETQRRLDIEKDLNAAIDERRQLLDDVSGKIDTIALAEAQAVKREELKNKQMLERTALENQRKDPGASAQARAQAEEAYQKLLKQQEVERAAISLKNAQEIADANAKNARQELNDKLAIDKISRETFFAQEQAAQTLQQLDYDRNVELGLYSDTVQANAAAELENQKVIRDARLAIVKEIFDYEDQRKQDQIDLEQALAVGGEDSPVVKQIRAEMAARKEAFDAQIKGIAATRDAQLEANDATAKANKEQSKFNKLIAGLKAVGGKDGPFGKLVDGVASTAVAYKKFNDDRKKQYESEEERTQAELTNMGNIAGGVKSMFAEKTAAYKAFDAIEKAMHVARIAMMVKEMLFDTTGTAAQVANSGTRIGAKTAEAEVSGVAAITNTLAGLPPPANFIAGAAMGAIVLAVLSSIGASSPSVSAPAITGEQRQEVTGTGYALDAQGNKYETGYGALGDPEKKLSTISDTLALMEEHAKESLNYDNKLLNSFRELASALEGASATIYASIPGLISGNLAGGIEPGGYSSQNLFGLLGTETVTTQLTDAGLRFKGTLEDLTRAGQAQVRVYEEGTKTVTDSGFLGMFGGGTDVYDLSNENAASAEIIKAVSEVFTSFKKNTQAFADEVGVSAYAVDSAFRSIKVGVEGILELSGKGLTQAEFNSQFESAVSVEMNKVYEIVFASFKEFQKAGEGLAEAAQRVKIENLSVVDSLYRLSQASDLANDKIVDSITAGRVYGFKNRAPRVTQVLVETTEQMTNSIVELAGGLENFRDQTSFFASNFLSEAEQLAPIQEALIGTMADLGYSTITTREQFKDLVQNLDLYTNAVGANGLTARETFQALMDVQESFDLVASAAEDAAQKIADEAADLQDRIDELTLTQTELRQKELATIDESNQALQERIWKLEDAAALLEEANSLQATLNSELGLTAELRAAELAQVSDANKTLQQQIYIVQDYKAALEAVSRATQTIINIRDRATNAYLSATDKVAAQQQRVSDLIVDAAKKMQEFGTSIREFINSALSKDTAKAAAGTFNAAVKQALTGDTEAISSITNLAQQAIQEAKASSSTTTEFNAARARILAEAAKVANFADQQAALVEIPAVEDPLVEAKNTLADLLKEQEAAKQVALDVGADLTKSVENLQAEYAAAQADLLSAIADKSVAKALAEKQQLSLDSIATSADSVNTNTYDTIQALYDTIVGGSDSALSEVIRSRFDSLDKDGNGLLTLSELESAGLLNSVEAEKLFKLLDNNSDARLTAAELDRSTAQEALITALTTGDNDRLSLTQFKELMKDKASDSYLTTVFNQLDTNQDGIVDAQEKVSGAFEALGLNITTLQTELKTSLSNGFTDLDTDRLTLAQFKEVTSASLSDTQQNALWKLLDADNDEMLSKSEAANIGISTLTTDLTAALGLGFKDLNTDRLTLAQFKAITNESLSDTQQNALWKLLDADNDSLISTSDLIANNLTTLNSAVTGSLSSGFDALGKDKLTLTDFKNITNDSLNETQQNALWKLMDADNDSLISKSEALSGLITTLDTNVGKDLTDGFDALGKDKLTLTDFKNITKDSLNETQQNALWKLLDVDNDQLISKAEANIEGSGVIAGRVLNLNSSLDDYSLAVGYGLSKVETSVGSGNNTMAILLRSIDSGIGQVKAESVAIKNNTSRIPSKIVLQPIKEVIKEVIKEKTVEKVVYKDPRSENPWDGSIFDGSTDSWVLGAAKGTAFFADGGTFTNNIVQAPTAFDMGLMGEAGPEAIMPLGRTKEGKLGVISTATKPTIEAPALSTSGASNSEKALLNEIRALKEEVSLLRYEARATATSSNKTSKILERVTRSGESLLVTDTATL